MRQEQIWTHYTITIVCIEQLIYLSIARCDLTETSFTGSQDSLTSTDIDNDLNSLFYLRSALILRHPLVTAVDQHPATLFLMFELYSDFVYRFMEYVCRLFIALRDNDMKIVMYENLVDEIGAGIYNNTKSSWMTQHGELYRQFIHSLRSTKQYLDNRINLKLDDLETASREISKKFYNAHAKIIDDSDDLQSFAAFSTIECWVTDLYSFWKYSITRLIGQHDCVDMRTIDLHCVCDKGHSAALDNILRMKIGVDNIALHKVCSGIIKGMAASEQLFSDIHHEIIVLTSKE